MAKFSYTVIVEAGEGNFGAYAPDLPGCAVGDSVEETLWEMEQAIEFHLEGLRLEGLSIPKPSIIAHREITAEAPASSFLRYGLVR